VTLAAAWVRRIADTEELLVATDSRLRGEGAWDCCPKILSLPRSDCVICFAGETLHAYPMMLQLRTAIDLFPRSRTRAMDLYDMKGHAIRVFNSMLEHVHDLPRGLTTPSNPNVEFLVAGYSWKRAHFVVWLIHYDQSIQRFTYRRVPNWRNVSPPRKAVFAGDNVEQARQRLVDILRARRKLTGGGLDMEPFEVLRDLIRDKRFARIGGPPQIVKIYRHLNCMPYAVYWPTRADGGISVLGRPLLSYETTEYLVLDPDTPVSVGKNGEATASWFQSM
jgi:hypothetical protein